MAARRGWRRGKDGGAARMAADCSAETACDDTHVSLFQLQEAASITLALQDGGVCFTVAWTSAPPPAAAAFESALYSIKEPPSW